MNSNVNSTLSSSSTADGLGFEVQGVQPNLFGFAESYRCSLRTDNWGEKDLNVGVSLPSTTKHLLPVSLNTRLYQEDRTNVNSTRTKCMSVSLSTMSKDLRHKFVTEYSARDETVADASLDRSSTSGVSLHGRVKDASCDILSALAPSTKSSLQYSYTNDTRNFGPSPTRGNLIEAIAEVNLTFT